MRMLGLAYVVVVMLGAATALGQKPKFELEHRETRLGRLPERTLPEQISVSPDGKRVAYIASRGVKVIAVVDGKESKPYEWIVRGHIGFTPDSKHVVYQIRRDDKVITVVDHIDGPAYEGIDDWVCSLQNGRIAYAAKRQGRFVPVIDGKEGKIYDNVRFGMLVGANHSAFIAEIAGKECLVVDGVEGRQFERIQDVRMSRDGKRVAFRAQRSTDKWYMVVDGVPGTIYSESEISPACFSDDGSRVGYLAGPETRRVLVVDGREMPTVGGRPVDGPFFSPDGKHLAYVVAKEGDTAAVVLDGVEGKTFDFIGDVRFSPDGKRLACVAQRGSRSLVVIDGVEQGQYDRVEGGSLTFSADGRRVAWVARRDNKQFIVVDGVEGRPYDRVLYQDGLAFSDNQTIFAMGVIERQVQPTSGDKVAKLITRYDLIGLEISIDEH
ncbi:MAG: hypothetical protein ACM359_04625 [Bacillota bacterium]